MNQRKLTLSIIAGLLLMAACAPLPAPISDTPPTSTPWPPLVTAQSTLAGQLGVATGAVTLVSSEPVEWPNACLGLAEPDEMCAEVITPGYRIVLVANGQRYTVHTDLAGSQARIAGLRADTPLPEAVIAAQRVLSEQLGVDLSTIRVVSTEAVEWRDGCLELAGPDEMCTMAIVPGYRVVLEVSDRQYVLHTNTSGSQVRAAGLPAPVNVISAGATFRAQMALAEQLSMAWRDVLVVSVEAVEWPDACLGIYLPDELCAQVVTPGYKVILEANGIQYEYHTDEMGDVLRTLSAPAND